MRPECENPARLPANRIYACRPVWHAANTLQGENMSGLRECAAGLAAALLLAGPVHCAPLWFDFEAGGGDIFTSKTDQDVDFSASGGSATYGAGIYTGLDGFVSIRGKALELDEGATLTISF